MYLGYGHGGGGYPAYQASAQLPGASVSSPLNKSANSLMPSRSSRSTCEGIGSPTSSPFSSPRDKRKPVLPVEVEQTVHAVEERVAHVAQTEYARMRMFADQAQVLQEGFQAMRVAREINEERRLKELHMMESNVLLEVANSRQAWTEFEGRATYLGNERVMEQQQLFSMQKAQHKAVHDDLVGKLAEEVGRITSMLEEHRTTRERCGTRIAASLETEFHKVQEALVSEQKNRFDAEGNMLHMVEDIFTRVRGEIQQERSAREGSQASLLALLEDACCRIEGNVIASSGNGGCSYPSIATRPDRG